LGISLGLITHDKSKYYKKDLINSEFAELKQKMQNIDQIFICEKNFNIERIDKVTCFRDLINELVFYIYNSLIRQAYILKTVGLKYVSQGSYNLLQITYHCMSLAMKFFISYVTNSNEFESTKLRLRNIEDGHKSILEKFTLSESEYLIIVEDDFKITYELSIHDIIYSILQIISKDQRIKIVNLSNSFSISELKIKFLIQSTISQVGYNQDLLLLEYPVLNTVCATLYKREIIQDLLMELENLNSFYLIPIDEKFNIALNRLIRKSILSLQCYASINPGIFTQRSIHGQ
jgi:hypothetical protein